LVFCRTALLALALLFIVVPAATRASQVLDPNGGSHQLSGFSNSGNLPIDPVSIPADVDTPGIAAFFSVPIVIVEHVSRPADDPIPPPPPPTEVAPLRAPPASLA
jgi:hypothetical protein